MKKTLTVLLALAVGTFMAFGDEAAAPKIAFGGGVFSGLVYQGGYSAGPTGLAAYDFLYSQKQNRSQLDFSIDAGNFGAEAMYRVNAQAEGAPVAVEPIFGYGWFKAFDKQLKVEGGLLGDYTFAGNGVVGDLLYFDAQSGYGLVATPAAVKGLTVEAFICPIDGTSPAGWQNPAYDGNYNAFGAGTYAVKYDIPGAATIWAGYQGRARYGASDAWTNAQAAYVAALTVNAVPNLSVNGQVFYHPNKSSGVSGMNIIDETVSYTLDKLTVGVEEINTMANGTTLSNGDAGPDFAFSVKPNVAYNLGSGFSVSAYFQYANKSNWYESDAAGSSDADYSIDAQLNYASGGYTLYLGGIYGNNAQVNQDTGDGLTDWYWGHNASAGYILYTGFGYWF